MRERSTKALVVALVLFAAPVLTAGIAAADVVHQYQPGVGVTFDRTQVQQGRQITWTSTGWQPGTAVGQVVTSDPIDLGAAIADSLGTMSYTWTVPTDFPLGLHTVTLTGLDLAGALVSVQGTFDVTPLAGALVDLTTTVPGETLPTTGDERTGPLLLLAIVLVAGGVGLTVLGRQRRAVPVGSRPD